MRERTTWNREQIAKLAAAAKKADDPRAMNQDHLKEQPAADAYNIGGPSEFAEDVHPSNKTWKVEYSGGEVKRNEIGMPEMRGDTFNHPEKTASEQEEDKDDDFLEKKAEVCIALAKRMLPKTASERLIEDQALSFMHMPDSALIDTATRLAAEEGDDEEEGQSKEAQDQQDDKKQSQQQQQDDKKQSQDQEQKKEAQDQQDDKKQSQGQDQEQKKEAQGQQQQDDKKQSQQQEEKQSQGQEQQKKEAQDQMAMYSQQACTALQQGNQQLAQELVQQMAQLQQQAQQQQQTMSQQQAEQQVQQMLAQAMQQLSQGQQQQPAMANDDQLLDQMLQQQEVFATDSSMPKTASGTTVASDIQLDGPSMDMSEVKMGSEDEALKVLFASYSEVQDAAQAHTASAGMTRTASRTVGTRPSGGVSQLGGGAGPEPAGRSDVDKLSGLWASAPDVSGVFD